MAQADRAETSHQAALLADDSQHHHPQEDHQDEEEQDQEQEQDQEEEEEDESREPPSLTSAQGEQIWVREEKVYPSLDRYFAHRRCDNCNRGVELIDMVILKHGGRPPTAAQQQQFQQQQQQQDHPESGSTCSDHSDRRDKNRLRANPNLILDHVTTPRKKQNQHQQQQQQLMNLGRSTSFTGPPPPPPVQPVNCVFCGSDTRFEHYNNHKVDQPRYRCIKCKQRFTNGGKLRNKRLKLCNKNTQSPINEEDDS